MLNLPRELIFNNGNKIVFTYDASGTKLKKQVYTGATLTGTTDYWGSAQYQNGALDFAMTPEGRTYNASGTFKYDYVIKDHLGNVRACFTHNGSAAQLLQVDDYYPHGNTFGSLVPSGRNNYLFNSKEFQPELNLNTFDFHARMYDPQVGRTWQLDPLAGMYADISPYSFLMNNPVRYVDPTGMSADDFDIAYSATGSATANAIYGGGWFIKGGGFSSVSTKAPGLNGLVYNWQTGQYLYQGQVISHAYAMMLAKPYTTPYYKNGHKVVYSPARGEYGYLQRGDGYFSGGEDGNKLGEAGNSGFSWVGVDNTSGGMQVLGSGVGLGFMDNAGQLMNAGGVAWGASELGLQVLRRNDGAKIIGRALGFGTQHTANALRETVKTIGTWGKKLGTAGMVISTTSYIAQGLDPYETISTATHANFWISAGIYSTAALIGGPVVGGLALLYGGLQLTSYMINGQTLEENIIGKK